MNRVTILLNSLPSYDRCDEIAHIISMEHFRADPESWHIVDGIPEGTPLHLKDQFEAEIAGRNLLNVQFLIINGPVSA